MAYHLRSEDECQQAEEWLTVLTDPQLHIVENQLLIYDEGQSWVSYSLVGVVYVGFEPYVIRS